jgi:hypothetical protein
VRRQNGLVAICLFAAGCGGGGNGSPKPIQGPAKEAAAVVERLHTALVQRDYQTVCDLLLSAAERRQAGGDQCPSILAQSAGDLRNPRITIEGIEIARDHALVRVRTTAVGQAPARDVIRLVREGGRYRIASLGG